MIEHSLKKLSKDSLIYGFGSVVQFITSFLLLPVFTRLFTPSDYGILDTISTLISILSLLLLLGLNSATQRYYFENRNDANVIISTSFWFLSLISLVICSIVIVNSSIISKLLFNSNQYYNLIIIAVATTPLALLITFSKDTLRLKFKAWKYNIISLAEFLLGVSLIIFLVLVLKKGIFGSLLGTLIASLIALILCLLFIKENIKLRFSYKYLKKLLGFGTPLVFASLSYWVISLADRFFILKLSTLEQLGLYSIGNKISSVLILFITALQLAWSPLIFSNYKEKGSDKLIVKTLTYSFLVFIFISLCITIYSYDILRLLAPPSYIDSVKVVGWLTLSLVFLGISGILSTGITIIKKTKYITISAFIAAVINTVLNFILIRYLGMVGAAIATLCAYLSLTILYYYYSQKFYHLDFELRKILKILIIGVVLICIGSTIKSDNIYLSISLKTLVTILFILLLFVTRIFDKEEIVYLKSFWQNFRSNKKMV